MSMLSSQCDELRQVAQVYRNLGKHATEQMLLEAADTIWELRDDLQRANADNDRLRGQYETVIADYRSEVAKLRELVRDYLIFYSQPGCTYCFCHDECRESEEPCMAFERLVDRTNELGVEVPR